jgi:hypothetical protein
MAESMPIKKFVEFFMFDFKATEWIGCKWPDMQIKFVVAFDRIKTKQTDIFIVAIINIDKSDESFVIYSKSDLESVLETGSLQGFYTPIPIPWCDNESVPIAKETVTPHWRQFLNETLVNHYTASMLL